MSLEKVIAVIVLYKSSLEDSESFRTLRSSIESLDQELTLLIYNNSPDYWGYKNELYDNYKIVYIEDALNSGVSKAYNVGYAYARSNNKDFVLLLDQDTKLPRDFFFKFFQSEKEYHKLNIGLFCPMIINNKGLLSPGKFLLFTSRRIKYLRIGINPLKGLSIINSGLIISSDLFGKVGGYNENIKLDFSDFDFLKRCLQFCKNIIVFEAKCEHSLSSDEDVTLEKALKRFEYYLDGAKFYNKSSFVALGLKIWTFLRSLKLDVKYRTFSFTRKYFK